MKDKILLFLLIFIVLLQIAGICFYLKEKKINDLKIQSLKLELEEVRTFKSFDSLEMNRKIESLEFQFKLESLK